MTRRRPATRVICRHCATRTSAYSSSRTGALVKKKKSEAVALRHKPPNSQAFDASQGAPTAGALAVYYRAGREPRRSLRTSKSFSKERARRSAAALTPPGLGRLIARARSGYGSRRGKGSIVASLGKKLREAATEAGRAEVASRPVRARGRRWSPMLSATSVELVPRTRPTSRVSSVERVRRRQGDDEDATGIINALRKGVTLTSCRLRGGQHFRRRRHTISTRRSLLTNDELERIWKNAARHRVFLVLDVDGSGRVSDREMEHASSRATRGFERDTFPDPEALRWRRGGGGGSTTWRRTRPPREDAVPALQTVHCYVVEHGEPKVLGEATSRCRRELEGDAEITLGSGVMRTSFKIQPEVRGRLRERRPALLVPAHRNVTQHRAQSHPWHATCRNDFEAGRGGPTLPTQSSAPSASRCMRTCRLEQGAERPPFSISTSVSSADSECTIVVGDQEDASALGAVTAKHRPRCTQHAQQIVRRRRSCRATTRTTTVHRVRRAGVVRGVLLRRRRASRAARAQGGEVQVARGIRPD